MIDYRWWVFIHIAGVFGFLLAHGVSVAVTFRLRRERDREKMRGLIQLSGSTIRMFYGSLALLLAGGVVAGFKGHWWHQKWIWISLGLLVGVSLLMLALARPYYRRVSEAAMLRASGAPRMSDEELATLLRSPLPVMIAGLGFAALLAILYLMIFKPA